MRHPLRAALLLTLLQIALVLALSHPKGGASRWGALCSWDGAWYSNIAEQGYHTTDPPVAQDMGRANVAFFPAYPLAARGIRALTGASSCTSLLVVSQASTLGFWWYALAILESWAVPAGLAALGALAIWVHAASFYLVVGYSESLFLAGLLGFLYWAARRPLGRRDALLAGAHGFVMSATRIVGLPAAAAPALGWIVERGRPRFARSAAACGLAAAGGLLFLAYCQLRFGHWNLYMKSIEIGWGVRSDYLAFFKPSTYALDWTMLWGALRVDAYQVSRFAVPATLALLVAAGLVDRQRFRSRLPFHAGAWILFFFSVAGRAEMNMLGMARYTFPIYVLAVLAATGGLAERGFRFDRSRRSHRFGAATAGVLAVFLLASQITLIIRFCQERWAS